MKKRVEGWKFKLFVQTMLLLFFLEKTRHPWGALRLWYTQNAVIKVGEERRLKDNVVTYEQACGEQQHRTVGAMIRSQGHGWVTVTLLVVSPNEGRNDMQKAPFSYLPMRWCERDERWHALQQPLIRYHIQPPEQAAAPKIDPLLSQKGGQVRQQPAELLSPPFPPYSQETRKKIFPAGSLTLKYSRPDPPREGWARASVLCHHPSIHPQEQTGSSWKTPGEGWGDGAPAYTGSEEPGKKKKSNYSTRKDVRRKKILLFYVCSSAGGVCSSACSTAGTVTPGRAGLLWGSSGLKYHAWS